MIQEMTKLSRETLIPFKQIFDDVCRKHPDAAAYCSFTKLRPTLYRQRANFKPAIPQSLEILYGQMKIYQPLENLNVCLVKSLKDETAVIITTDGLLEGLKKSKEIFVDGTFAVLPKEPHMGQLYTIHIRCMDNGIATILVLCERRTATLYAVLRARAMSDAGGRRGDFYPRNMVSIAILRMWRKLGLTNVPNTVVRMAMSPALVPETKFQQAILIIQEEADNIASNFPNVLLFMTYMRTNWLKKASQL
ncbi:uncharacterized protein LOC143359616 [Halictus rubicundus]|uniref:uncharacterized protein LOC143359616 n=1 Tax=Halictus rubicundus TaxID=77578 RepID=UPI004036C343